MRELHNRKGSALLIVLGMLSFVVVSAIAFAAYMRTSRLPSSYLRRTAASRLLAKAAMAEAIEEIDAAIGNNAYPDQRVEANDSKSSSTRTGATYSRNYWWHNVFIGDRTWLTPDDTVSTLTLEGLAYIPPPLVNEARRYSRLSHAATWHNLGFNSGRYAFCAIDVSDCLDVNRLVADGRRNSGRRRVTLAHVFEKAGDHKSYEKQPSGWETFMSTFREKLTDDDEAMRPRFTSSKVPLVSMADWNLAVQADSSCGLTSPFGKYAYSGTEKQFYGIGDISDPEAERIRAMRFVTDSYLPPRELEGDECNLASRDGQPFDSFSENATLVQVLAMGESGTRGMQLINKRVCKLDLVGLYDYLDDNDVPVSLAVPTTERVPMVCAIKPTFTSTIALEGGKATVVDTVKDLAARTLTETLEYRLSGSQFLGLSAVQALVAFPFRRDDAIDTPSFAYDGCIRLFFAPRDIGFRLTADTLRPKSDSDFSTKNDVCENGVFMVKLASPSPPSFSSVDTEDSAVKTVNFPITGNPLSSALSAPLFTVKVRYNLDSANNPDRTSPQYMEAHCNIPPLKEDGSPDEDYTDDNRFLNIVKGRSGKQLALHAAVYIRVKGDDGKTVDLVPACADDDTLNGKSNALRPVAETICGKTGPILRFTSRDDVKFDPDGFDSLAGTPQTFLPEGIMCPDPRFNHAPENWIGEAVSDPQTWVDKCGAHDRDGDIFMFVSNQGYLQSIYELAFLPNLSELERSGAAVQGNCQTPQRASTSYPTAIGECVNGSLMWNTYRCFKNRNGGRHDFEGLGLVQNDSAYRVNPYVQSVDALMPVFANTPYDWWAASTNNDDIAVASLDNAKDFNAKYAFSGMNPDAKFAWSDLRAIAENFRDGVRSSNGDWESAFDNLGWEGDEDHFCGAELGGDTDELYGVDRKFLYGFWHDAFANRQQLFLVFVRAEPMMMGGGAVGQTPPSLGARAVALVWRDPEPNGTDNIDRPHRTRVLFYRQFE